MNYELRGGNHNLVLTDIPYLIKKDQRAVDLFFGASTFFIRPMVIDKHNVQIASQ